MSYTVLKERPVNKIRKEHECFTCTRTSPIGSKMTYHSGVFEGQFISYYTCPTCDEIIKSNIMAEYEYGELVDSRRNPEELLSLLKEIKHISK